MAHHAKVPAVDLHRAIGEEKIKPVKNEIEKPFKLCFAPAGSHGVNDIDFLRKQYLIHLQKNFWFILQIRVHNPDALSRCEGQTGRDRTLMPEVASQNNQLDRWIDASPLFDKVCASIGRSIAHKEEFPRDWPILNFF